LLGLGGVAQAGQTAKIILYRHDATPWPNPTFKIQLENGPSIRLGNGYHAALDVPPGDHVLTLKHGLVRDRLEINLKPGETIYVEAHVGPWVVNFERSEDQVHAKAIVSTLKALNTQRGAQ
jgi:hypothetical protein